jgi:hypothetical protein
VHQQMIQERRQQQQLAREKADLDQADPLPGPTTGGSPGGGSTAPISTRRPGLAAAQHQSIEGQGLSMPIIAIQNAISWSNSEPQNKFINTYHYTLALQARTLLGNQNSFPHTPVRVIQMVTPQPQQPQQSSVGTPPGTVVTAVSVTKCVFILEANALNDSGNSVKSTKCRKSTQKSTKNFQKRSKFSRQNSENSDKFQCPKTLLEWF